MHAIFTSACLCARKQGSLSSSSLRLFSLTHRDAIEDASAQANRPFLYPVLSFLVVRHTCLLCLCFVCRGGVGFGYEKGATVEEWMQPL